MRIPTRAALLTLTNRIRLRAPLVAFALLMAGHHSGQASSPAAADITLEEIFGTWRARQDSLKSLRYRWDEVKVVAAGAYDGAPAGASAEGAGKKPPQDIRTDFQYHFFYIPECYRYEVNGFEWQPTSESAEPVRMVSSKCGDVNANYTRISNGEIVDGSGMSMGFRFGSAQSFKESRNYHLLPIAICYLPFDRDVGLFSDAASWRLAEDVAVVDGKTCRLLECRKGDLSYQCWVAAEGLLPVKFELLVRGKPNLTLQSRYDMSGPPTAPPVLAGWSGSLRHSISLKLTASFVATVKTSDFDVAIPTSAFDLDFPPGTQVRDEPAGRIYLIQDDGTGRLPSDAPRAGNALIIAVSSVLAISMFTIVALVLRRKSTKKLNDTLT